MLWRMRASRRVVAWAHGTAPPHTGARVRAAAWHLHGTTRKARQEGPHTPCHPVCAQARLLLAPDVGALFGLSSEIWEQHRGALLECAHAAATTQLGLYEVRENLTCVLGKIVRRIELGTVGRKPFSLAPKGRGGASKDMRYLEAVAITACPADKHHHLQNMRTGQLAPTPVQRQQAEEAGDTERYRRFALKLALVSVGADHAWVARRLLSPLTTPPGSPQPPLPKRRRVATA